MADYGYNTGGYSTTSYGAQGGAGGGGFMTGGSQTSPSVNRVGFSEINTHKLLLTVHTELQRWNFTACHSQATYRSGVNRRSRLQDRPNPDRPSNVRRPSPKYLSASYKCNL
jgi:hypothetical protein